MSGITLFAFVQKFLCDRTFVCDAPAIMYELPMFDMFPENPKGIVEPVPGKKFPPKFVTPVTPKDDNPVCLVRSLLPIGKPKINEFFAKNQKTNYSGKFSYFLRQRK